MALGVAQAGGFQVNIGALGRTKPGSAAILLSVVLLSACSTGAQQQAAQIQQTETQTGVGVRDCIDGVMAKPDYAHLKTKMFVSSDATATPPLEYLSDNSHPTKSEIADIYKYYSDIRPCRKIALEGEARVHPARVNALVTGYDATDKLAVEFVSGRMTWGNFNQQRASIIVQMRQQLREAQSMIASQLQNQHQFELAQRQRASESLQRWAYQQQVLENQRIAAMSAAASNQSPIIIPCGYNGSYFDCAPH